MEYVRLGDLYSISKGKKVEELEIKHDAAIRYIQIEDLRNNNNLKYCLDTDKYVKVTENDIIIAWDGANAGTIGYGLKGAIGSTLAALKTDSQDIYPKYIGYYLSSKSQYLRDTCTGATIPHIQRSILESIKIPLLSLEEQIKVSNILDQAQELIDKRKAQIEALDELKKSIYQQMFLAIHWEKNKLEEIIKEKGAIKCGPFGSQLLISEFTDEGIPVLGIENVGENKFVYTDNKYISEEKYTQLNAFKVQPGDVLISRTGTVGRTCVVPDEFSLGIIGPNLLKITPNTQIITSNYLASTFNYSRDVVNQVKLNSPGATVAVFNTGNLKKVSIPVPPIELQNQFAEIVENIEKQKELLNKSLVELENNFNSLMERAFNGGPLR